MTKSIIPLSTERLLVERRLQRQHEFSYSPVTLILSVISRARIAWIVIISPLPNRSLQLSAHTYMETTNPTPKLTQASHKSSQANLQNPSSSPRIKQRQELCRRRRFTAPRLASRTPDRTSAPTPTQKVPFHYLPVQLCVEDP